MATLYPSLQVYFVLLLSLFVQSCNNFSNPIIARSIVQEPLPISPISNRRIAIIRQLAEQKLISAGWELIDFDEGEHALKVKAIEKYENFISKPYDLSVSIAPDIDLEKVSRLSPKQQQRLVHIYPKEGYITILKEGLLGGMMEGMENQEEKAVKNNLLADIMMQALHNDIVAQYKLGVMYYNGQGAAQDYQKALRWFQEAGERGHASAQNNLGWMYQNGIGIAQDHQKALEWFKRSASQGHLIAQHTLGWIYRNGIGVVQDYQQALRWFLEAANQGLADAQYNLGSMYYNAQGVTQDYQQALRWYLKAAKQGHAVAQYKLGDMYYHAQGVAQNYQQALRWYLEAANQGHAVARYNVGMMYFTQQGVAKNYQL